MTATNGMSPRIRVVVISPDEALAAFLQAELPSSSYEVVRVSPGAGVVDARRRAGPLDIAVVDRVDERPGVAATEIALLKDRYPRILVIAVSERSTETDARVLEQGVFFYLAARPRSDLVRVIEAAGGRPATLGSDRAHRSA